MAGFTVQAVVGGRPHLAVELSAQGPVEVIETGVKPCPQCVENAASDEPQNPPLHPHCHCEWVQIDISEHISI